MDLFNKFSKKAADIIGSSWAFVFACLSIIVWMITGPIFHYSDTWQLLINTGTTIITFLIVFLLQHTQNRDTKTLQIKLDELILKITKADNMRMALDEMTDDQLEVLEKKYKEIAKNRKKDSSHRS